MAMKQARADADELRLKARLKPQPELGELYVHICAAFEPACEIAKMSRKSDYLLPWQFVYAQTKLEEHLGRVEALVLASDVLTRWPATPGTTFSWKAGDSALEVALLFSRAVHMATVVARTQSVGMLGRKPPELRISEPDPDPKVVAWHAATVKELQDHTLQPLPAWPVWEITRDMGKMGSLLADEYERTIASMPASRGPVSETSSPRRMNKFLKQDQVTRTLRQHPEWTDTQIAKAAGCARSSLYRMKDFKAVRALLATEREQLPKGSKNGDTGEVEAWR
jgi:hypothetical protein